MSLTENDIKNLKLEEPSYTKYIIIGAISIAAIIIVAFVFVSGSIPEEKVESINLKSMSYISSKLSTVNAELKEISKQSQDLTNILSTLSRHCSDDMSKIAVFGSVFTKDFNTTCGEDCFLSKENSTYRITRKIKSFDWVTKYTKLDTSECIFNKTPELKKALLVLNLNKKSSEKILLSWINAKLILPSSGKCNSIANSIDQINAAELGLKAIQSGSDSMKNSILSIDIINQSHKNLSSSKISKTIRESIDNRYNEKIIEIYSNIVKNYDTSLDAHFTQSAKANIDLIFDQEELQLIKKCQDISLSENIFQEFTKENYNTFLNKYSQSKLIDALPTAIISKGFQEMKGI